jgi:hypothetical protein
MDHWITLSPSYPLYFHYIPISIWITFRVRVRRSPQIHGCAGDDRSSEALPSWVAVANGPLACRHGADSRGSMFFQWGTSWNQFISIYIVSQPYSGFTWALDHGNNDWTKLYIYIYVYIKSGLNSERWLCKACRIGSKPATKHRKARFYHSVNIEALNPPQRFLWPTRSTIWNTSVRIYE